MAELQRAAAAFDACGALRYRDSAERELGKLGHRPHRRTRAGNTDGTSIDSLTERELQVARLVVDRKTNPEIAAELFLSQKTVETHLRNIFRKIDVSTRVELARAVERADHGARATRPRRRGRRHLDQGRLSRNQVEDQGDAPMSQRPGSGKLSPCHRRKSQDKTMRSVRAARREANAMFEVMARLKIRDGELDGFKQQAAEMMRQTREKDTKTLRYDWFLSDGPECEVREGYVDADA